MYRRVVIRSYKCVVIRSVSRLISAFGVYEVKALFFVAANA